MKQIKISLKQRGADVERILDTLGLNLTLIGQNYKTILLVDCQTDGSAADISLPLAAKMAAQGKKGVLIDANLLQSDLSTRFQYQAETGLVHYLGGLCAIEEALYETNVPGLSLIPAGYTVANSGLLLSSPQFRALVEDCAGKFDFVVLTAAPIDISEDAETVAALCDGALFIARHGMSHAKKIMLTKTRIQNASCGVIGCVVTDAPQPASYLATAK